MKIVIGGVLAAGLLASPALAQTTSGAWSDVPARFQIDAGYFRMNPSTVLRYNGANGSGDINFEDDLGLPQTSDTFWIDGTWRAGRRHQLKLAFTTFSRIASDHTLQRDFTWGGETYNAGLTATADSGTSIVGGYYRFAAFRNERFEIGPTIGIGYLSLDAGIRATGTITKPGGGTESRNLDKSASIGSVTGALGGYLEGWVTKRFVVQSDFLYIKATPGDSEAAVTDWRVAADYYFFRNAGLGIQYKFNRYSYDRGILVSELGGEVTYQGIQVFLSFRF